MHTCKHHTNNACSQFTVGVNGEIIQHVDLADKANHCAPSNPATNSNSVGVELEGALGTPFTKHQYVAVARIIRKLHDLTGFLPDPASSDFTTKAREFIVGHSEISPQRKQDPGTNFNYGLLIHLVKNTPATDRGSIFREPFDPAAANEVTLQAMLNEAANPSSHSEAAILAAAQSSAFSLQRMTELSFPSRGEIASSAATAAQRLSAFLDQKLAAQETMMQSLEINRVTVPEGYTEYLNSNTGLYEES